MGDFIVRGSGRWDDRIESSNPQAPGKSLPRPDKSLPQTANLPQQEFFADTLDALYVKKETMSEWEKTVKAARDNIKNVENWRVVEGSGMSMSKGKATMSMRWPRRACTPAGARRPETPAGARARRGTLAPWCPPAAPSGVHALRGTQTDPRRRRTHAPTGRH